MIYDTGVAPVRRGVGGFEKPGYYAVGQYGIDVAGPFANEEDAMRAVLQYIERHPAKTPENGKPLLIPNAKLTGRGTES